MARHTRVAPKGHNKQQENKSTVEASPVVVPTKPQEHFITPQSSQKSSELTISHNLPTQSVSKGSITGISIGIIFLLLLIVIFLIKKTGSSGRLNF